MGTSKNQGSWLFAMICFALVISLLVSSIEHWDTPHTLASDILSIVGLFCGWLQVPPEKFVSLNISPFVKKILLFPSLLRKHLANIVVLFICIVFCLSAVVIDGRTIYQVTRPRGSESSPTAIIRPPATAIPSPEISPITGAFNKVIIGATRVVSDSLQQQDTYNWRLEKGLCDFVGGSYHAYINNSGPPTECYASGLPTSIDMRRVAIQVDMVLLKGNNGGILFGDIHGDRYYFAVNSSGQFNVFHPGYGAFLCDGSGPAPAGSDPTCPISNYSPGPTRLQVAIQQERVSLYVNSQPVWNGPNIGILSTGTIGFLAGYYELSTDVYFKNVQVWQLGTSNQSRTNS